MNKTLDRNLEMKDSEIEWIGKIPKGWEIRRFSSCISKSNAGEIIPKEFWGKGCELLYTCAKEPLLSNYEGFPEGKRTQKDNLLLTRNGTPYIHIPKLNSIYSNVVQRVILEKDNSSFIRYTLMQGSKSIIGNGDIIESFNMGKWNSTSIPLPPLYEQQAIANYLDEQVGKIDELIAEQNQAIENWKAYRQSLITEKVTKGLNPSVDMKDSGIEWIGEIPKEWKLPLLGAHFKERNEKVSDKKYKPLSVTKQGIVPQLENIAKTDNNDNRKKICINDFVINSRSDRKGSSGLSRYEGSTSNISIVLELRGIFPMYTHYLLKSYGFVEEFYRWGNGIVEDLWSTRYSSMKKINIPFPPLHEQQAIANYLDEKCLKIDQMIEQKQVFIKQLEEYKQSLIYECVTGKRCVL